MRFAILAMVLCLSFAAQAAPAGPAKVGWIDLQRTLTETKAGKAAKSRLEAEKELKQKQVNERKDKLKKAADDLEKQRGIMKPEAIAAKERELQDEYAQLQQLFLSLQQDLAKQEATLTREIFTKASGIIESIAKRDGYTLIIEKNEGAVLWADASLDITPEVNRRLDAGEGASDTGSAPAAPKKDTPKKGK